MPAPSVTICSFRLGGGDGVSVEAAKWAWALGELGWGVRTLAGEGRADTLLPGLAAGAGGASWGSPERAALEQALAGADLVVVENLCSLPLNPPAAAAIAEALAGRPAILHHHDLASQRPALTHLFPPPDDPCWLHVTINELSAAELAAGGIKATVLRNRFDPDPPPGRREPVRAALGVGACEHLLLHPVRAIARKNVPGAIDLAETAGATYWLLGDAEDGYGPALEAALAASRAPVLRGWPAAPAAASEPAFTIDDLYAACDGVLLPSTWEGFGNPSVEAATHDRPLAIGDYPVALELAALGFEFFSAATDDSRKAFCHFLEHPDPALLARNHDVARRKLPLDGLPAAIGQLLDRLACGPVRSW